MIGAAGGVVSSSTTYSKPFSRVAVPCPSTLTATSTTPAAPVGVSATSVVSSTQATLSARPAPK